MPDQIPHWQSLLSKRPNCNWPEGDDDGGEEHLDVDNKDVIAVDNNDVIAVDNKNVIAVDKNDAIAVDNKDAIAVDNKDVIALENTFLNGLRCDCDSQAMVKSISAQKAQTQIRPLVPLRLRLRATRSKKALTIQ